MPPKQDKGIKSKKGQDATLPPPAPAEPVPLVLPTETMELIADESDRFAEKKNQQASSDDFDFSDFDKELRALTGEDGGDGGTQWDKLMDNALKDDLVPVPLDEDNSEEEDDDEEVEDSDISSVPSDPFLYKGDKTSEESEGIADHRHLLDRHSFMNLRDPGLADALTPREIALEKTYDGIQANKHDYKKLCIELGVQPLSRFLRNLENEKMDLSWYLMSAKEMVAVCKVLCNNTHVRRLSLRGNAAGQEGGDAMAEMIKNNYTITHLDIAQTEILPSMKKICEAVSMNIVLESLDISRNDLTSKEMVFVRDFLKKTSTLRELWLSRNSIEDPGLLFLSKGIFDNTSLQLLDISYNRLRGTMNTFPFFDSIANHPEFLSLDLAGNLLGDVSAYGLARIMFNNFNFQYINVAYNLLTNAVCETLRNTLAKKKTWVKLMKMKDVRDRDFNYKLWLPLFGDREKNVFPSKTLGPLWTLKVNL